MSSTTYLSVQPANLFKKSASRISKKKDPKDCRNFSCSSNNLLFYFISHKISEYRKLIKIILLIGRLSYYSNVRSGRINNVSSLFVSQKTFGWPLLIYYLVLFYLQKWNLWDPPQLDIILTLPYYAIPTVILCLSNNNNPYLNKNLQVEVQHFCQQFFGFMAWLISRTGNKKMEGKGNYCFTVRSRKGGFTVLGIKSKFSCRFEC